MVTGNGSPYAPFSATPTSIPSTRPFNIITKTVAQAIPQSITTAITFNTSGDGVPYTPGMVSSAFPSRIIIPVTGKYLVGGMMDWESAASTGTRLTYIALNGVATALVPAHNNVRAFGNSFSQTALGLLSLAAGDYIELFVLTSLAGEDVGFSSITGGGLGNPYLWAAWEDH